MYLKRCQSAVCSEAIGPHYKEFMMKQMRKVSVFTLGLDSSTLELGGLDKHLDIKIRFFFMKSQKGFRTHILILSQCGKNQQINNSKLL